MIHEQLPFAQQGRGWQALAVSSPEADSLEPDQHIVDGPIAGIGDDTGFCAPARCGGATTVQTVYSYKDARDPDAAAPGRSADRRRAEGEPPAPADPVGSDRGDGDRVAQVGGEPLEVVPVGGDDRDRDRSGRFGGLGDGDVDNRRRRFEERQVGGAVGGGAVERMIGRPADPVEVRGRRAMPIPADFDADRHRNDHPDPFTASPALVGDVQVGEGVGVFRVGGIGQGCNGLVVEDDDSGPARFHAERRAAARPAA
jgi:hypothetical protein